MRPLLGASDGGDLGPRWPSPHAPSWQTLIKEEEEIKRSSPVCAVRVTQVPTTGTHVASTMTPTAHMPFPPPRARGEGGVTSLLRIVGTARRPQMR